MSVFIESQSKVNPTFTVGVSLNRKPTKGQIGLEIEVEGNKFPKPPGHEGTHEPRILPGSKVWSYVHDGSLRGEDNAEYVLTRPIQFDAVDAALRELWGHFADYGSILDESNRTSVHVHLNCQDFHLNRLTAFMALYFTFEEILTEWCGDHRVGNLFCLRAKDAPGIITQMKRFIQKDGSGPLSDSLHYSALNGQALAKFGSLEVRTLRGCRDPETILEWVQVLRRLYDMSASYDDPRGICDAFSAGGPISFFEEMLGDEAGVIRAGLNWDDDRLRDSLYEGVRLAQDLCYCRDWSQFKPVDIRPDPFGRSPKATMQGLQAATSPVVLQSAPSSGNNTLYDPFAPISSEGAVPAPIWVNNAVNYLTETENAQF